MVTPKIYRRLFGYVEKIDWNNLVNYFTDSITTITSSSSIGVEQFTTLVATSSASITATLPSISTVTTRQVYEVISKYGNTKDVIVAGYGTDKINGSPNFTLYAEEILSLQKAGTEWIVVR